MSYHGSENVRRGNYPATINVRIIGLLCIGSALFLSSSGSGSAGSGSSGTDDCTEANLLSTMSRYLFPFILEYSLVAIGAIACVLFTGIGPDKDDNNTVARGIKNLIRVFTQKTSGESQRPATNEEGTEDGEHRGST